MSKVFLFFLPGEMTGRTSVTGRASALPAVRKPGRKPSYRGSGNALDRSDTYSYINEVGVENFFLSVSGFDQ